MSRTQDSRGKRNSCRANDAFLRQGAQNNRGSGTIAYSIGAGRDVLTIDQRCVKSLILPCPIEDHPVNRQAVCLSEHRAYIFSN